MSGKNYGLGVIVGRFQILHKGHSMIINRALELCDELGILVGSSQESGSYKNPFSYEERRALLLEAFPEVRVFPLPDIGIGNCRGWGDYVIEQVVQDFGRKPDVFISGEEVRRESWFPEDMPEIFVAKSIDVSASRMKEFIIDDNKKEWDEYIEPKIAGHYDYMRQRIIESKDNIKTKSL